MGLLFTFAHGQYLGLTVQRVLLASLSCCDAFVLSSPTPITASIVVRTRSLPFRDAAWQSLFLVACVLVASLRETGLILLAVLGRDHRRCWASGDRDRF